jgi:hypothetical protein
MLVFEKVEGIIFVFDKYLFLLPERGGTNHESGFCGVFGREQCRA